MENHNQLKTTLRVSEKEFFLKTLVNPTVPVGALLGCLLQLSSQISQNTETASSVTLITFSFMKTKY